MISYFLIIVDKRLSLILLAVQEMPRLVESGKLKIFLLHSTFSMSEMESALRTIPMGQCSPTAGWFRHCLSRTKKAAVAMLSCFIYPGWRLWRPKSGSDFLDGICWRPICYMHKNVSRSYHVKSLIAGLQLYGVCAAALRCDVYKVNKAEVLVEHAHVHMPPIRGLVHGGIMFHISSETRLDE